MYSFNIITKGTSKWILKFFSEFLFDALLNKVQN